MSEEIKEADAYKIFRQLEERKKRANPYTFYDKDELIDEILKQEDEIEDLQQKVEQKDKEIDRLNNIINELEKWVKENNTNNRDIYGYEMEDTKVIYLDDFLNKLKELKENK